jgi:hypothetical protein
MRQNPLFIDPRYNYIYTLHHDDTVDPYPNI